MTDAPEADGSTAALADAVRAIATAETVEAVVSAAREAFGDVLDSDGPSAPRLVAYEHAQDRDALVVLVPEEEDDGDVPVSDHPLGSLLEAGKIAPAPTEELPTDGSGIAVPVAGVGVLVIDAGDARAAGSARDALRTLAATTLTRLRDLRRVADRDEEIRRLTRENEQLQEFADIVAHDLRNPLSIASGRLELVAEKFEDDDVEAIAQAHDRIESIIDHTLTLAKTETERVSTAAVDLDTVVRSAWRNVDTGTATLTVQSSMTLTADPVRLQQLLENLFRNAVEHASPESDPDDASIGVAITVGPIEADTDGADGTDAGGFFVEDDGPGIPPGERENIFERGETSKDDGTGLGLAIVDEIATEHDWDIRVTEDEDGGARFEVTGVE